MFHNVLVNVIGPAINAAWGWLNSLWSAFNGFGGFFIAIFTMICVFRFMFMPFLGYHRTYASRFNEERPTNYQPKPWEYSSSNPNGRPRG